MVGEEDLADPPRTGVALVSLPYHEDGRGRVTVIENGIDLPVTFKRLYYISGVPAAQSRGDHAHRQSQTMLVALVGSFDVHTDDGFTRTTFRLDDPASGLLIPPRHWLRADNFSPGSVCLALSSHLYEEDDYWRDYAEFRRAMRSQA
jgi:hypothetical protein